MKRNFFARYPRTTLLVVVLMISAGLDKAAHLIFVPDEATDFIRHNYFRIKHLYFHHGFMPMQRASHEWGDRVYPFNTNSLGFRDSAPRIIAKESDKLRVLFMGDSFAECPGVSFEESFIGLLKKYSDTAKYELLNAGVGSYSPKLYYLKTRYLIENIGFIPDRMIVLPDISDIHDEVRYSEFEADVASNSIPRQKLKEWEYRIKNSLKLNSFIYYAVSTAFQESNAAEFQNAKTTRPVVVNDGREKMRIAHADRGNWTSDTVQYRAWGKRGLSMALNNMQQLSDLCMLYDIKMELVIYPWPNQILNRELECIYRSVWKEFAGKNNLPLHDLFPDFIENQHPDSIVIKYFIQNDLHWNKAGHRFVADLLFEKLGLGSIEPE